MTQPVKNPFLEFSISAQREYDSINGAATRIKGGDLRPCVQQHFFAQRYDELERQYANFGKDHDFGARRTLDQINKTIDEMYKKCSKPR